MAIKRFKIIRQKKRESTEAKTKKQGILVLLLWSPSSSVNGEGDIDGEIFTIDEWLSMFVSLRLLFCSWSPGIRHRSRLRELTSVSSFSVFIASLPRLSRITLYHHSLFLWRRNTVVEVSPVWSGCHLFDVIFSVLCQGKEYVTVK